MLFKPMHRAGWDGLYTGTNSDILPCLPNGHNPTTGLRKQFRHRAGLANVCQILSAGKWVRVLIVRLKSRESNSASVKRLLELMLDGVEIIISTPCNPRKWVLNISGQLQYEAGAFGITMPLGIGSELWVFTPWFDPVCGTRLGLEVIGLPGDTPLFFISIPLGMGSELCVFRPCWDPVRGMLLGSIDIEVPGVRPLFFIIIPLGIGSELCVLTPCEDPVCGEVNASDVVAALGGCGWAQPLIVRATQPKNASRDRAWVRLVISNSLFWRGIRRENSLVPRHDPCYNRYPVYRSTRQFSQTREIPRNGEHDSTVGR